MVVVVAGFVAVVVAVVVWGEDSFSGGWEARYKVACHWVGWLV